MTCSPMASSSAASCGRPRRWRDAVDMDADLRRSRRPLADARAMRPRARPRWRRSRRAGGASKRAPGIIPRAQRGNKAPLPVRGQQTVVGSFEQGGLDGAGIYFLWGSYWFWVRRRRHASNRANPGRQDVLLSSLRSTLFGDVLAAFQE